MTARLFLTAALVLGASALVLARGSLGQAQDKYGHGRGAEKVLYIWAQDQAHVTPDFLAVIDFDEASPKYGQVINVVPLPPPGNIGNEPHHCHLNSNKTILGCGGLLSLLKNQNGIFFFDVSDAKKPRFMFSTKAVESSMTDDFLAIENGGFLISQMGSSTGMAPAASRNSTARCISSQTTLAPYRCLTSGPPRHRWTGSIPTASPRVRI